MSDIQYFLLIVLITVSEILNILKMNKIEQMLLIGWENERKQR